MRRLPRALDLTVEGDVQMVEEEILRLPGSGPGDSTPLSIHGARVLEVLNRIDLAVRQAQRALDGLGEEDA